jgi:putative DNA primase/helicase
LIEEYGPFETKEAETGGSGRHCIFQYPETVEIRNSVGLVGEGLDIRGEGGYIVAAPSLHPSGKRYRWLNDTLPALPPAWLIEKSTAKKEAKEAPPKGKAPEGKATGHKVSEIYPTSGGPIPEGQRGTRIFKIGCAIWGQGKAKDLINLHHQLGEINGCRCQPPLDAEEVTRIAASIAARYVRGVPAEEAEETDSSEEVITGEWEDFIA